MKTSRIPVMPRPARAPFGLFAVSESRRVILPLKGVECDFSVVSGIGEVSMTQIFRQDNEKPLDCEYLFPLPADASVYFCEADINGRTIRAQVREREEAREIAAEKKAAGFRTALVEAERENLFMLSLGNVQPRDLVIIQLKYFQTLRSLAGRPSIEIPFCPGIRYIPGSPLLRSNKGEGVIDDTDEVPDASKITPPRLDAEHPDAAYIEVRGTIDGTFIKENELVSPSHPIVVQRIGQEWRISLSDKGDVPDRDFVLRWSESAVGAVAARSWLSEKNGETYALLEIRAPAQAPTERVPMDFYFLVDRSGSMKGEKWNKAAEALQSCVRVLAPTDRAMVTLFESQFQDFAEGPLTVKELLKDKQFQAIGKLGTGGGTELRPALNHALEVAARHSANRCKSLILITDAQVENAPAILELMKAAPDFPAHCFGIDVALNDSLLLALCRQQGGTFHSLNPKDDIEQAVTALAKTLGQPVLVGLALPDGWEPADASIPNLYAGQIHYLSARSSAGGPLELKARDACAQPVRVQFDRPSAASEAPYLHWCRSRIRRLVAEGRDKTAVALSIQSNLICPLTAFVAWDESEKVAVATHELVQPNLEPAWAGNLYRSAALSGRAASMKVMQFSRSFGAGKAQKYVGMDFEEQLPPLRKSMDIDELALKRELSDICHRAAVVDWQPLLKAIFDWIAEAVGSERADRIRAFEWVAQELKSHAKRFDQARASQDQAEMQEARRKLHELLKDFVANLVLGKK